MCSHSDRFSFESYRRSGIPAFTLLELLVTSAITAILMVGVLELVAHLGLDQRRLLRQESSPDTQHLVNLLRSDLSRGVQLFVDTPQVIAIDGYGAIDPVTLIASGRAARFTYHVVQTESGPLLVREQRLFDETGPSIECVATGVRSIALTPLELSMTPVPSSPVRVGTVGPARSRLPAASQPTTPQMPARVRLRIEWTDLHYGPLDRELVLR